MLFCFFDPFYYDEFYYESCLLFTPADEVYIVANVPPAGPDVAFVDAGPPKPAYDFFLLKFVDICPPLLLITDTPALLFLVPMLPVIAVEATP